MEPLHAKLGALVCVFILPLVCTLLPYKVSSVIASKGENGKRILSYLMCFGGGVFFATYMLHMGPEVRDLLKVSLEDPYKIKYPLADCIMASGFFLVLLMEKLTLRLHKRRREKKKKLKQQKCLQFNEHRDCNVSNGHTPHNDAAIPHSSLGSGDNHHGCNCPSTLVQPVDIEDLSPDGTHCALFGTGECCADEPMVKLQLNDNENCHMLNAKNVHNEEGKKTLEELEQQHTHGSRSLILLMALSLHRIFEGMSVGLQSSVANVWGLFLAVMCHETVIGFSLGLQFIKAGFLFRRMVLASFLSSIIMPIGVAVGTAISESGKASPTLDIVNGVLQAVATGTFIYVTFFEILQEEMSPTDASLGKVASMLVGFLVMAALCAIPEENITVAPHPLLMGDLSALCNATMGSGAVAG